MLVDIEAIARHYGGKVCKGNALIPTPGHSARDRGTAIKSCAQAPDGCLVACYNGTRADALAVKEMLRADGFLEAESGRALTAAERRSIRQADLARKRERLAAEEAAARCAADLWRDASRADPAHPYLVAKGLETFGIRQAGRDLLVPMVDPGFRLWNVQRIRPDGFKLFGKDARTAGLFWPHGVHMHDGKPSAGPLVIGEGFATMAAVHSSTGFGVVAAMSARNLETVARAVRKLFPSRELIVAADDDRHLGKNIGLEAAIRAAEAVGGVMATPRPETCLADSSADFADIPRGDVAGRIEAARLGE
ncbi:toprim domain-containing protein [Aurantiacibacter poecillastricola]|uniref:toprim domain-containing protein n=1 Tax=Aurantiacibacter poecillastricola TaxID=3064385 RepID=UPI00273CF574|nr:toprim domain-containing protein [Aurantiacibacter sp. 219JJ12-13]MDP5263203.1 toprim domain-containing protein [Aurantiacibacter sp. 219JJ12-13]